MLKHLITLTMLLSMCSATAQKPNRTQAGQAGQAGQAAGHGFTVLFKSSAIMASSYNVFGFCPVTVEVDKVISGNFSWVVDLTVTTGRLWASTATDTPTTAHQNYAVNAKAAWVSNRWRRVFVRAEAGVSGVYAVMDDPQRNDHDVEHRFFPSLMAELYLGIRIGKRCELMISPLIFTPAAFRYSPRRIGNRSEHRYWDLNAIPLSLGVKF